MYVLGFKISGGICVVGWMEGAENGSGWLGEDGACLLDPGCEKEGRWREGESAGKGQGRLWIRRNRGSGEGRSMGKAGEQGEA